MGGLPLLRSAEDSRRWTGRGVLFENSGRDGYRSEGLTPGHIQEVLFLNSPKGLKGGDRMTSPGFAFDGNLTGGL